MADATQETDRILDPGMFTLNSLYLAKAYWPILMDVARSNQGKMEGYLLIQYRDLVETAKSRHPDDNVVQNAIPTSIGKKLDPINWFCSANKLPNLTCLAVNARGEPGVGYMRNKNWQMELREVAGYDWSSCEISFQTYIGVQEQERIAKAKQQRALMGESEARDLLWNWWKPKKVTYPAISHEQKEKIVMLIRQWVPVTEAVAAVLGIEPEE